MKRRSFLFAGAAFATTLVSLANAAPDTKEPDSAKAGNKGQDDKGQNDKVQKEVCVVCGATQGAPPAPVLATATYKGQLYPFCSVDCRSEFLKKPRRFLESDIGQPAPALRLKDRQNKSVSLSDFKGQVVLLDFWATWCPSCQEALRLLQEQHTQYSNKGFTVVGISLLSPPAERDKAAQAAKLSYPLLIGTDTVAEAFKVIRLPTMILVGRDGRILRRFGPSADKVTLATAIEQAL